MHNNRRCRLYRFSSCRKDAGTGNSISINDLSNIFLNNFLLKKKVIYKSARKGDILFSGADINKIKKELNFESKYSINQGLKKLTEESFF